MIFPLAAAIGLAVYLALRWVIRRDDLALTIREATVEGRYLLLLDRIERGEEHLLPKSRRGV